MSTPTIAQLNNASSQVTRYLSPIFLLFGTIGNLLCCLIFIQRTLRSNPCVIYFLIACISNIISIISGIPSRMLSNWNILSDRTETSAVLCKSRIIVLLTSRNIASWLLLLATVDRYLISSSNANIRRKSNLKQAYQWTIIICILSLSIWSETLYCFDANLVGTPLKCYAKSAPCRIVNDLAQSFITTIIPSSLMLIFGLCTIANIRQIQQVRPTMTNNNNNNTTTNNNNPIRRKKTDQSLTRMLFIQVTLLTIFNMPQAIQKFYLTYTFYQSKSPDQVALENLLFNIALMFTYIPNCIPFYIYILTSDLFRKTLYQLIRTILRCFN